MRKTKAIYGDEARAALKSGVDQVYNAVAPTMGARGRNSIYKKFNMPIVTNDGVSIAREILPEDPYEYLGAEAVKQASEQTNYDAGDGTSSTIVLAKTLIDLGLLATQGEDGYNPMILRREMEVGKQKLIEELKNRAIPVKDLIEVARVSVEDEEMAQLVAKVVQDVGVEGSIMVEESPGGEIRVEMMKGYTWQQGYVSNWMATNTKGEAILEDCAVIITDRYMNLNVDFYGAMTEFAQKGIQSILLIAENVEGELLQTIVANKQKGSINVVAVKRPQDAEELEDLAVLTGATAVTSEKDIKKITANHAGSAKRVVVTRDRTVLVGLPEQQPFVDERIEAVRAQIKEEDHAKYGHIDVLKRRLSRLTGGVARIKVGALTEAEQAYKKMKIDDAVGACVAALEEGIVPGGGTTLRDLGEVLDEDIKGEVLLKAALPHPYLKILQNAGIILNESDPMENYNVLTGEIVDDMIKEGVVDPAKVVRCAIENAVSIASTLITTESAIAEVPDEPFQVVQG